MIRRSQQRRSATASQTAPLNGEMEESRRGRFAGRIGVILLIYITGLLLALTGEYLPPTGWAEGERAPATVVASVDFSCIDLSKTEMEQAQAERDTPPVFTINTAPQSSGIRTLDKLFDRLIQSRNQVPDQQETPLDFASIVDLLNIPLSAEEVASLAAPGAEREAQDSLRSVLRKAWLAGIVSEEERRTRFQGIAAKGFVVIRRSDGTLDAPCSVDRLPTTEEAAATAAQELHTAGFATNLSPERLRAFLRTWLAPNLLYDPRATTENRLAARKAVTPSLMTVKAGATLVESGQRLTAQQAALLAAHEARLRAVESPTDRILRRVGIAGFLLMGLILCLALGQMLRPELLQRDTHLVIWLVLTAASLGLTKGLLHLVQLSPRLPAAAVSMVAPFALSPIIAAMLLGGRSALIIGMWSAFCIVAFLRNDFAWLPYAWLVTATMAYAARHVRKRTQVYRAGLLAGGVSVVWSLILVAWRQPSVETTLLQTATGLMANMFCGVLAILLAPLFEWAFKTTTDLTLLELSDLGHPLLQRLALEAAGTYHHSMVTAHLAEAAAARIGADALLVRVAAYFHDIGKLAKPDFYIENTTAGENPHQALTPEMSALLIRSHVQEGLAMARRFKLPTSIQAAILQHHGTSLISYFYRQALERPRDPGSAPPDEAAFRYDGPRPQTREMGILMLADAVEAAVRSLHHPNHARIEDMIREITDSKIQDSQLDQCPLSLAEIRIIRDSFAFTLANMLHIRIAYRDDEDEDRPDQPPETVGSSVAFDPTPRTIADSDESKTRNREPGQGGPDSNR